jgi:hypothetical protein
MANAEVVSRKTTDSQWAKARIDWYSDPDDLRERDELAGHLLTLPGVTKPESPNTVINRSRDRRW